MTLDHRLSGVEPEPVIALSSGRPLLSVERTNRLLRRHGVARYLAEALVHEAVASTVILTDAEIHPLIRAAVEHEGVDGKEGLVTWLDNRRWSFDDLVASASLDERLRRWRHWRFGSEVEIRFLERKLDLDRVVYSLLRVSQLDLAHELYLQLAEDGADFSTLVEGFSEGSEKASRGLIGPVALTTGHPELTRRLRSGRPGQLWSPFNVGGMWAIVRLEQRFPAQLDEAMRNRMEQELFDLWVAEMVEQLLEGRTLPPIHGPQPSPVSP